MKKLITYSFIFFPTFCFGKGIYFGYQFDPGSRGGVIIGYQINSVFRIEAHKNAYPHCQNFGISGKYFVGTRNSYIVSGISQKECYDYNSEKENNKLVWNVLNIGYGYEFGIDQDDKWSFPIELGIGPGLNTVDMTWSPQVSGGYGILYGVYRH